MNQAMKRTPMDAGGFTAYPFCSSALTTSVVSNGSAADTGGSSKYGNIIDLQAYPGYESLSVVAGVRALITADTDDGSVSGHFVTDTSSAFGGSTTIGSTFTLNIFPSSGTSTEEAAFVATVNLNSDECHRYIRFLMVVQPTSGDGDYVICAPTYLLGGRDESPTTHNVQLNGQTSAIAS